MDQGVGIADLTKGEQSIWQDNPLGGLVTEL